VFVVSVFASIPGLLLLQRFAPIGSREPELEAAEEVERKPVTRGRLALAGAAAGVLGFAAAAAISALLSALKQMRSHPGASFGWGEELARLLAPSTTAGWLRLAGPAVLGIVTAFAALALLA